MSLAEGNLELVGMSPTAAWPLGSHVNKGDGGSPRFTDSDDDMCRHHLDVVACPLTSWSLSLSFVHRAGGVACHPLLLFVRWAGEVVHWSRLVTGEVARRPL